MKISNDVFYVGVNDQSVKLFEGQYEVKAGMAYNSYIITDQKTALFDTVDAPYYEQWVQNIKGVLGDKQPDYLVVLHVEPDHSSNVYDFMQNFKSTVIVGNAKTFSMLKNFYGDDFADRRIIVKEGDTLSLGNRTLTFLTAPMVHWPEVMVAYDDKDKILFSADAFGKFGCMDDGKNWADEARRYYIGIVGKFGVQVQALLKKAANLDINVICPLHGNVLTQNLSYYIDLYDKWSSYRPEEEGVLIAYSTVYGNTEKAVFALKEELEGKGERVEIINLTKEDMHQAVALAFKYSKLVLATTTYNGGIFPCMKEFIDHLTDRNFKNRKIGFIENGSWAPIATKKMKEMLADCKDLTLIEDGVTLLSGFTQTAKEQVKALASQL